MAHWLFKTEPSCFSLDDLKSRPGMTEQWDGVRNYQARNHLAEMRVGDGVLFYHAQSDKAVVGTAEVVKEAHPDPTQFDPKHPAYDPGSDRGAPRWCRSRPASSSSGPTRPRLGAFSKANPSDVAARTRYRRRAVWGRAQSVV